MYIELSDDEIVSEIEDMCERCYPNLHAWQACKRIREEHDGSPAGTEIKQLEWLLGCTYEEWINEHRV